MLDQRKDVPMAGAVLHLEFAPRSSFNRVIAAETAFLSLASAVGEEVTEVRDPLDWQLTSAVTESDLIRIQLVPERRSDRIDVSAPLRVVDAVVDGVSTLAHSDDRPAYFNDDALQGVEDLTQLRNDVRELSIRNGDRGALLDAAVEMHVKQFLQLSYSEIGSVEGTLEGVILHHDRYFNVYDFLTGKRVRCNFGHRIDLGTITEALERRVAVYGTVNVRSNGQPVTMTAEQLDIFPDERDLPNIGSVQGIIR